MREKNQMLVTVGTLSVSVMVMLTNSVKLCQPTERKE